MLVVSFVGYKNEEISVAGKSSLKITLKEDSKASAYNRKCKYTLRMTKLHSGKVAAEDDFVEENEEPLADDPVLELSLIHISRCA